MSSPLSSSSAARSLLRGLLSPVTAPASLVWSLAATIYSSAAYISSTNRLEYPKKPETQSSSTASSTQTEQEISATPAPTPSTTSVPEPLFPFTDEYVAFLNKQLENATPQEVLRWATLSLPHLFQTTAFGLTGLVTLDMLSKIAAERAESNGESKADAKNPIDLIFLDTLYHFDETLDLAHRASSRYATTLHIYRPANCSTRADFEKQHGQNLWTADPDIYDYLVKVEPSRRSYEEHNVRAVITGRRRSQKGERSSIPIIELDRAGPVPIIKVNPLASWGYEQVWAYVKENNVPYNVLHDRGYKSIGDYHSTRPTKAGESERDGRWEGQAKTECGLHKDYLKMRASYVAAKKRKAALAAATHGADNVMVAPKVEVQ